MHDDMDEMIRRATRVEVPAGVEDRLRGRLMEFRTRVEQRPPASLLRAPALRLLAMAAALLAAVAVGLVLIPRQSSASRVYAAAQLKRSQSLEYTIVLNATPYVAVDFSFLAPGYRRISCSWGIEVRSDGTTGKQIALFHATRNYVAEVGKQIESSDDFLEQLRSLPQAADEVLGEQRAGGARLIGYRLHKAPPNTGIPGLLAFDIWVDAATREAHHVDITIQEKGQPAHQMHIQNIRAGAPIDRSLFDLTPPAGYTAIVKPSGEPQTVPPGSVQNTWALRAEIGQTGALEGVVVPMTGSYLQTSAALKQVEAYLKTKGVTPVGPPLGRFWSEQHWETGYPVPPGTQAEAPFQVVSLPAGLSASVVVNGAWAKDSDGRWGAFLKSVIEQGYLPAGPAMEIWSGEDAKESTQSTEMRMPVTKAN